MFKRCFPLLFIGEGGNDGEVEKEIICCLRLWVFFLMVYSEAVARVVRLRKNLRTYF